MLFHCFTKRKASLGTLLAAIKRQKRYNHQLSQYRCTGIGQGHDKHDSTTPYSTGQLFVSIDLNYRGIVLFPFECNVNNKACTLTQNSIENEHPMYDNMPLTITKNVVLVTDDEELETTSKSEGDLELNENVSILQDIYEKKHLYYLCLVDSRDDPKTFSSKSSNNFINFLDLPGINIIGQEDLYPFSGSEEVPFKHDHLNEFFNSNLEKNPQYEPTSRFESYMDEWMSGALLRPSPNLVYIQTTNHIRVTVVPMFMIQLPYTNSTRYFWKYFVHIENLGMETMILRERHWMINSFDINKFNVRPVSGRGVVGYEPELSPNANPTFFYSSSVHLDAENGQMWGKYVFENKQKGTHVNVEIPCFDLKTLK